MLYGHIDNLELHVGMQAEEAKPPIPGAGLCPGYTISRAILSDAVALVRGDPYLTTELTGKIFRIIESGGCLKSSSVQLDVLGISGFLPVEE